MTAPHGFWRLRNLAATVVAASAAIALWLYVIALPGEPPIVVRTLPRAADATQQRAYYERIEAAEVRELQRERSEDVALAGEVVVIVAAAVVASLPYFIETLRRE